MSSGEQNEVAGCARAGLGGGKENILVWINSKGSGQPQKGMSCLAEESLGFIRGDSARGGGEGISSFISGRGQKGRR